MGNRVKGKVAIVTGAGSSGPGIGNGKAAAILYAREGARVMLVDTNLRAAEETRRLIDAEGGESFAFKADVSIAAECRNMVGKCVQALGRIDILHNNVGIMAAGGPVELKEETWDRVIDVNLKSIFLTCKFAIPYMEKQGSGSIINISSVASTRARLNAPSIAYAASKAGIEALTREIAVQYASRGIRVNTIVLGGINTPSVSTDHPGVDVDELKRKRAAACPTGKLGDAWDTAHAALFLASDEARYMTGTTVLVDGGQSAMLKWI